MANSGAMPKQDALKQQRYSRSEGVLPYFLRLKRPARNRLPSGQLSHPA